MAQAVVGGRPRTEVLEAYFQKYPETPKAIILKSDLLGLGHWFTDAALAATEGCSVKTYRLFSYDLMTMSEMRRQELTFAVCVMPDLRWDGIGEVLIRRAVSWPSCAKRLPEIRFAVQAEIVSAAADELATPP